jgi:hypothetical protein
MVEPLRQQRVGRIEGKKAIEEDTKEEYEIPESEMIEGGLESCLTE